MNTLLLQKRLVAHGYKITVDGDLGPETRAALSKFQKSLGLAGSGRPGPKTYAALEAKPASKPAVSAVPAKPPASIPEYMRIAASYLGTREAPGKANNPLVVQMFGLAGHPQITQDSVPWCAAFVAACLAKAKVPNEVTKSLRLWAAAYAQIGTSIPLSSPVWGCIGVKTRTGGGHVGFVVAANEKYVWMLGGNQGDNVTVGRFPRSSFSAFRLPTGIDRKLLPRLPTSAAGAANPTEA